MAETHLKTARLRFDPDEIQFLAGDHGSLTGTPYSGVRYPWGLPILDPDAAGYFLHPGGMESMSILTERPTPGSQSGNFWEPSPGWNKAGALFRRPRVLMIVGEGATAGRLSTLFDDMEPLGVTIVVSQRGFAASRPLAAVLPVVGLTTENLGPFALNGEFRRFRPTYPEGSFVGGDVLVVEINQFNWWYGGLGLGDATSARGNAAYSQYVFTSVGLPAPDPPPGGATYFPAAPDPSDVFTEDRVVAVFPSEAEADAAAVEPLVAGCRSYEHHVYHFDQADDGGGTYPANTVVDDAGIYSLLYGSVPWASRNLVAAGDNDGLWAQIRTNALAFFS